MAKARTLVGLDVHAAKVVALAAASALLAASIAVADRGSGDKAPTASVSKQVKKLSKRVKKLQKQLNSVRGDVNNIELKAGPQGPAGAQGAQGAQGLVGPGGTEIATTARLTGGNLIVQEATDAGVPVPISGGTYTQGANEITMFLFTVSFQGPAVCTNPTSSNVTVDASGPVPNVPANEGFITISPNATETRHQTLQSCLPAPGVDTVRNLTVTARNSCDLNGEEYVLTDVKVDVLTFG